MPPALESQGVPSLPPTHPPTGFGEPPAGDKAALPHVIVRDDGPVRQAEGAVVDAVGDGLLEQEQRQVVVIGLGVVERVGEDPAHPAGDVAPAQVVAASCHLQPVGPAQRRDLESLQTRPWGTREGAEGRQQRALCSGQVAGEGGLARTLVPRGTAGRRARPAANQRPALATQGEFFTRVGSRGRGKRSGAISCRQNKAQRKPLLFRKRHSQDPQKMATAPQRLLQTFSRGRRSSAGSELLPGPTRPFSWLRLASRKKPLRRDSCTAQSSSVSSWRCAGHKGCCSLTLHRGQAQRAAEGAGAEAHQWP